MRSICLWQDRPPAPHPLGVSRSPYRPPEGCCPTSGRLDEQVELMETDWRARASYFLSLHKTIPLKFDS